MARTSRAWETGERKRTVQCSFCGGEHRRRSKEQKECRDAAKRGKPPPARVEEAASRPATKGTETTRYETDPLRGDKVGNAIGKQLRAGNKPRKIAKMFNVPLSRVADVQRRIESGP